IKWSADSARVFYAAEQNTVGVVELYSVAIDGLQQRRLSGDMTAGGSLANGASWQLSPDGRYVAYLADQRNDERVELYVNAADGSQAARAVNGALTPGGDVSSLSWDANSLRLYYVADQLSDGTEELFAVDVDGNYLQ